MVASTTPDLTLVGRGDLRTLTVRNIPAEVDLAITQQAKLAGRSKSDYLQEFLMAMFGDLIGNVIRTGELVALMDREMAHRTDAMLSKNRFDAGATRRFGLKWWDNPRLACSNRIQGTRFYGKNRSGHR